MAGETAATEADRENGGGKDDTENSRRPSVKGMEGEAQGNGTSRNKETVSGTGSEKSDLNDLRMEEKERCKNGVSNLWCKCVVAGISRQRVY